MDGPRERNIGVHSLTHTTRWQRLESHIAVMWCAIVFMGLMMSAGAAPCFIWGFEASERVIGFAALGLLVVGMLDHGLMARLSAWWNKPRYPLGLVFALTWPVVPRWIRPLMATWWLIHFLASGAAALAMTWVIGELEPFSGDAIQMLVLALAVILTFGATGASNVFLMIMVWTVCPKPEMATRVWRYRWAIDALVTVAVWLAAFLLLG